MKANQCQHFHLGRCRAPDAPSKSCVLMDRRVDGCVWFVKVRKGPEPLTLADYLSRAAMRSAARARRGPHKEKEPK